MGAGFAPDRNKCPGLSPARAWRRCAAEGEERVAGSWGDVRPAPPYCQRLRSVSGSRVAARPVARELTRDAARARRSEEHTSELQSLMRISYAVFCLKTKSYFTFFLCI